MADAEDLYQQVALVLWEKFDQFVPGTDFGVVGDSGGGPDDQEFPPRQAAEQGFVQRRSDAANRRLRNRQMHRSRRRRRTEALQACLKRLPQVGPRIGRTMLRVGYQDQGHRGRRRPQRRCRVHGAVPHSTGVVGLHRASHHIRGKNMTPTRRTVRSPIYAELIDAAVCRAIVRRRATAARRAAARR